MTAAQTTSPDLFDDAIRAWVEGTVNGTVISARRQPRWREQWFIDTEDADRHRTDLLLRFARNPALAATSSARRRFSIASEARVLAALQGSGVLVPKLYGVHEQTGAILMERLAGRAEIYAVPLATERMDLARQYLDNLARLHTLDHDQLGLLREPHATGSPFGHGVADYFDLADEDFRASEPRLRWPVPLLQLARRWVRANPPRPGRPLRLIQGDTGPAQFLFEDGKVTGLIDWEQAHIGDPMLDLSSLRLRNMLYPMAPITDLFAYYQERNGIPVDRAAVEYYTVVKLMYTSMLGAGNVQHPSADAEMALQIIYWDVVLQRGLGEALLDALDEPVMAPPQPAIDKHSEMFVLHSLLADRLGSPGFARHQADDYQRSTVALANALVHNSAAGASIERDDLDDASAVLGVPLTSWRQALERLDGAVGAIRVDSDAGPLAQVLARMAARRHMRWLPLGQLDAWEEATAARPELPTYDGRLLEPVDWARLS